MKKILFAFILFFTIPFATGCSQEVAGMKLTKEDKKTIQNEFDHYNNQTNEIIGVINELDAQYEMQYLDEDDFDKGLIYLKNEYIPKYEAAIHKVKEISTKSKALNKIHETLILANEKELEGIKTEVVYLESVENEAYDLEEKVDKLYSESEKLFTKYEKDSKKIANAVGINLVIE